MTTRSWPEKPLPASGSVLAEVLATARLAADADLAVSVNLEIRPEPGSGVPLLTGTLPSWDMVVRAGHAAAKQWMGLRGQNPSDIVVDITPAASHIAASAEKKPRVEIRIGEIPSAVDAVVVGAGICGMMAAYYLARAGLAVAVFDSSYRIGQMTTSWNNGMIHPGHDPEPGTLKARLNVEGNAAWSSVMKSLGLAFERRPSLVVGFGPEEAPRLTELLNKARINGVPAASLISGTEARQIEPRLSTSISGALHLPSTASIDPVAVTQSLAAAVRSLGGTVTLTAPVATITVDKATVTGVEVDGRHVSASLVINAAGVDADLLAATAGSRRYSIHPRRGSLVLFDPGADERYPTSVGPIPGRYSKGGGMTARPDGLTTGGPTAVEQEARIAVPPTQAEIDHIVALGERIYPKFPLQSAVNIGSAVRAATYSEDFIVGPAPGVTGLVDIAGTQSPAIASAPAIAAHVVRTLRGLGYLPDPH